MNEFGELRSACHSGEISRAHDIIKEIGTAEAVEYAKGVLGFVPFDHHRNKGMSILDRLRKNKSARVDVWSQIAGVDYKDHIDIEPGIVEQYTWIVHKRAQKLRDEFLDGKSYYLSHIEGRTKQMLAMYGAVTQESTFFSALSGLDLKCKWIRTHHGEVYPSKNQVRREVELALIQAEFIRQRRRHG